MTALAYALLPAERTKTYLQPGQIVAAVEPTTVTTILGSCVAVCLWDPVLGAGGMNHYLLPQWVGNGLSSPRFGNVAVQRLIDRLLSLGSSKKNLKAKVFGGACVLDAFRAREETIGSQNVEVANQVLAEAGIPVVNADVGGRRGRKLIFNLDDGGAWVRLL